MFGSIRKHQQWIWIIVAGITILSFVIYFSPDSKMSLSSFFRGSGPTGIDRGTIYDRPITETEFQRASRELHFRYFMERGEWPQQDEFTQRRMEQDAIMRFMLMTKIHEYDIQPSETAVARQAAVFLHGTPLNVFEEKFLSQSPARLTLKDFENFVTTEVGIQQLANVLGASGRMFDAKEAEGMYKKENSSVEGALAVFHSTNYLSKVEVTGTNLTNYFNSQGGRYWTMEKREVNYVVFASSNFLAKADEKIAEIKDFVDRVNKDYQTMVERKDTNLISGPDGKVNEAASKLMIREKARDYLAEVEARRAANQYATELMDTAAKGPTNKVELFEKMAATRGLKLQTTPAFDRSGLHDTNLPAGLEARAFKLTQLEPIDYSALRDEHGVFLISLKNRIDPKPPALDSMRDRVTADYKMSEALHLARVAATNFSVMASNGLAQKKSFAALCKEHHAERILLTPFSMATNSLPGADEAGIPLQQLKELANELKEGQVSTGVTNTNGAVVFYLEKRLPVDPVKMAADMPQYLSRLRAIRQNETFNAWFRKQFESTKLNLPVPRETKRRAIVNYVSPGGKLDKARLTALLKKSDYAAEAKDVTEPMGLWKVLEENPSLEAQLYPKVPKQGM